MPKTIGSDDLAVLRYLDERADALRRELGLHARGEVVAWYESVCGRREFTAVADGYGAFELVAHEGRNPNDRVELNRERYDDERAAGDAAMRLGEYGVRWEDRDTPVPGEDE
jgi:hypothetical protein